MLSIANLPLYIYHRLCLAKPMTTKLRSKVLVLLKQGPQCNKFTYRNIHIIGQKKKRVDDHITNKQILDKNK